VQGGTVSYYRFLDDVAHPIAFPQASAVMGFVPPTGDAKARKVFE
jgi:hypothetical protein